MIYKMMVVIMEELFFQRGLRKAAGKALQVGGSNDENRHKWSAEQVAS